MAGRGASAIARLTKRHVEELLASYDDDPVNALTVALRIVLDAPGAGWADLIAASGLDDERCRRLITHDTAALDTLASELNELRGLGRHRSSSRHAPGAS